MNVSRYQTQYRRMLLPFIVGCVTTVAGCSRLDRDPGTEFVNAAGLSTQELVNVLAKSPDLNRPSRLHHGWTPLILAIYKHKEEAVDILLAHGADANAADTKERQPPLMWAIDMWSDNTNVIVTLLEHGADPRMTNGLGWDAFRMARQAPNAAELGEILNRATRMTWPDQGERMK
jgi:ankyrin repeat protein